MTEAEYIAALAEIDRIWDQAEATEESGRRFLALCMAIEAHEDEHYPIGKDLEELMEGPINA